MLHVVISETEKNRLYILLKGSINDAEITEVTIKIKTAIDQLRPNFDTILDISELNPLSPTGRDIIMDAQSYMFNKHVRKAVLIVGYPVSKIQFESSSKKAGYEVKSVLTLKEAYVFLDENLIINDL